VNAMGNRCEVNVCQCKHGVAGIGLDGRCLSHGQELCASCHFGYSLQHNSCHMTGWFEHDQKRTKNIRGEWNWYRRAFIGLGSGIFVIIIVFWYRWQISAPCDDGLDKDEELASLLKEEVNERAQKQKKMEEEK